MEVIKDHIETIRLVRDTIESGMPVTDSEILIRQKSHMKKIYKRIVLGD